MKVNSKIALVVLVTGLFGIKFFLENNASQFNPDTKNDQVLNLESTSSQNTSLKQPVEASKGEAKTGSPSTNSTITEERTNLEDDLPEYLEEFQEISIIHRKSLLQQMQTLSQYGKRQVNSEDLVSELEKQQLAPEIRIDKNPYTGNLNVVRTNKVLPGTRYFHAQFFEDEDGSEYVQHLSFEFKGSNQSFDAVEQTVLNIFKDSALVQNQKNESFRSWKRDDGYVIWMKKMDESDIQDNPFNAYTKEDIGTIRVAIELDIHDHAPAFHAEQGSMEETP